METYHAPTPLPAPETDWVERLRKGNFIWLLKERVYAQVVFTYEPPEPGTIAGHIGIRKI